MLGVLLLYHHHYSDAFAFSLIFYPLTDTNFSEFASYSLPPHLTEVVVGLTLFRCIYLH